MEQVVALVRVEQLAGIEQFFHLLFVERFEQVMAAEDLVVYAVKHHARRPVSIEQQQTSGFSLAQVLGDGAGQTLMMVKVWPIGRVAAAWDQCRRATKPSRQSGSTNSCG